MNSYSVHSQEAPPRSSPYSEVNPQREEGFKATWKFRNQDQEPQLVPSLLLSSAANPPFAAATMQITTA